MSAKRSGTEEHKAALTQSDYKAKLRSSGGGEHIITSKDVATLPKPGTTAPASIEFLNDYQISFLLAPDATQLTRQLFVVSTSSAAERTQIHVGGEATQEGKFSHEEQMRRERARLMATGVTSYQLSKGGGNDDCAPKMGLIPIACIRDLTWESERGSIPFRGSALSQTTILRVDCEL